MQCSASFEANYLFKKGSSIVTLNNHQKTLKKYFNLLKYKYLIPWLMITPHRRSQIHRRQNTKNIRLHHTGQQAQ